MTLISSLINLSVCAVIMPKPTMSAELTTADDTPSTAVGLTQAMLVKTMLI